MTTLRKLSFCRSCLKQPFAEPCPKFSETFCANIRLQLTNLSLISDSYNFAKEQLNKIVEQTSGWVFWQWHNFSSENNSKWVWNNLSVMNKVEPPPSCIKVAFKFVIFVILLTGLIVCLHRCFTHYFDYPTYTEVSMVDQVNSEFPAITFCPQVKDKIKATVLQVTEI